MQKYDNVFFLQNWYFYKDSNIVHNITHFSTDCNCWAPGRKICLSSTKSSAPIYCIKWSEINCKDGKEGFNMVPPSNNELWFCPQDGFSAAANGNMWCNLHLQSLSSFTRGNRRVHFLRWIMKHRYVVSQPSITEIEKSIFSSHLTQTWQTDG